MPLFKQVDPRHILLEQRKLARRQGGSQQQSQKMSYPRAEKRKMEREDSSEVEEERPTLDVVGLMAAITTLDYAGVKKLARPDVGSRRERLEIVNLALKIFASYGYTSPCRGIFKLLLTWTFGNEEEVIMAVIEPEMSGIHIPEQNRSEFRSFHLFLQKRTTF